MPSRYQNINAVIFKLNVAKDADRVVHLLTEGGSREVVIAKGVKKATSRKAHAVDLLNQVSVKLSEGRGSLKVMTEVKLLNKAAVFKNDYQGLMFSQAVCELIDMFAQEGEEEAGYYNNVVDLMRVGQSSNLLVVLSALILRFLYLSGNLKLDESVGARVYKSQKFMLSHNFASIQRLSLSQKEQSSMLGLHTSWLETVVERPFRTAKLLVDAV